MGKVKDLVGQRFGKLVVVEQVGVDAKYKEALWKCDCDCGGTKIVSAQSLKKGSTRSCGCFRIEDLTGKRFGRWLVLSPSNGDIKSLYWDCRCDCGTERSISGLSLRSGNSSSCGCFCKEQTSRANTTHGHRRDGKTTRTLKSRESMIQRCCNPRNSAYKNYGGRGIAVCERWLDKEIGFDNFLEDMGECPSNIHQIDRIDNDGPYFPENCRWATPEEQSNNRRSNHKITFRGETHNLKEWSKLLLISDATLKARIDRYGWSIERAFTTPVKHKDNFRPHGLTEI
jgi:hypothetical protein